MKTNNSRNIAKALISKLYTEKEMHEAADPNSKATERYDEVLNLLMEKGYGKEKRIRRVNTEVPIGKLRLSRGNWMFGRQVLRIVESDRRSEGGTEALTSKKVIVMSK